MLRESLLLVALCAAAAEAAAQCPDGTPPPCAGARRPAVRATPSPAERARRFLVLPFRNVTRGAEQEWLVEGSPILLADAIGRWQDLSVVSDERLYPAMRRHGLQPGTVLELSRVRRVAEETDGWTAVTGEVLAIGGGVRISARAWDVVTNRELMRVTAETQPGEDVRGAYGRIGSRLLGAAGLDSAAPSLEAATTHSLEAYRAYLRGVSHLRRSEVRRARDALLEAVRLDTMFAQAYMRLAEASFSISPSDIMDLTSPGIRYVDRAAALADRLPARRRDVVRAMSDVVHGRLTAARAALSRLVQTDSSDVDATEWLGSLEAVDFLLVPAPGGGERPRGSINTSLRLIKRALELDPARHQLYADLVVYHAQGAGYGLGQARGYRRELPSLGAMMMANPERFYTYVLRDTFELVPSESLSVVPAESLAASKRRALAAATAWALRWRQEAPGEADSHLWLSRMYDMQDSLDSALASLARADSLGVETGIEVTAVRRLSLLRRLGRFGEARAIAESLWAAGDIVPIGSRTRLEAVTEVLRVLLLVGDYERADRVVAGLADALRSQAPSDIVEMATLGMLSGASGTLMGSAPTSPLVDSLLAVVRRRPPTGRVARWLPALIGVSAGEVKGDTAHVRSAMLAAARDLAGRGEGLLSYRLVVMLDSTARAAAGTESWYQPRRDSIREEIAATAQRFRPASATVAGDSAVFEWTVAGGDTVTWNRPSTPALKSEYGWVVVAGTYHVVVLFSARIDDRAQHGTLSQLLEQSSRSVMDTAAAGDGATGLMTRLSSASMVRAEALPGRLRVVVRHPRLLAYLRQQRPAEVFFRVEPCARLSQELPRCTVQPQAMTYN